MNLENKGGIIMELLFVLALLTKVLGGKKAKFNLKQFNKNVKILDKILTINIDK
jgi:hypothetical protein